jgi:hypothetical protein
MSPLVIPGYESGIPEKTESGTNTSFTNELRNPNAMSLMDYL